ncbi:hypothetical protein [Macrococcus armenti]|uniref:hypothetical protein n=1 Tax=Macrococcus armenti TaxID=2875764 RepID=UPI001CCFBF95|nr:hypothetical protein [Macrococcus armenti]UBH09501.1 hypothetical protein LAU41_04815 [Macrococcus armenti]
MQKINRKEYMKEYRKRNAERMKELNRINYLKRKEKLQTVKTDDTILRLIQAINHIREILGEKPIPITKRVNKKSVK